MFIDLSNFSLSIFDRRYTDTHSELGRIGGKLYPQLLAKVCVINAPTYMSVVMSMMRLFASARACAKVELFTTSEKLWNSDYAKNNLIRANFPQFLGGEKLDNELTDEMRGKLLCDIEPYQVTINARSKKEFSVKIPKFNKKKQRCCVTYLISVIKKDIIVKSFASNNTLSTSVLMDNEKLRAENGPYKGEWNIENGDEGSVVLIEFDNLHSMLRTKTVVYSFDVVVKDIMKEGEMKE